MLKMTQRNMVLWILALGLNVVFFFQNCAPKGSAPSSNMVLFQAPTTSESLVIITPPGQTEEDHKSSDKGSIGSCDKLAVSDILLKIVSISTNLENPNLASFEIIDSDKSISLEKLTLKVKANRTENIKNITLILNAQGNKILTADNVVIDLQTPVNEQSVVRVNLAKEYSITEGQTYNLLLTINPNELIAATQQNNCLFKPLIQNADLAYIQ